MDIDKLSRIQSQLAGLARELALLKDDGDPSNFIEDAEDLADEAADLLRRQIADMQIIEAEDAADVAAILADADSF